jgi:hypothetical protein
VRIGDIADFPLHRVFRKSSFAMQLRSTRPIGDGLETPYWHAA